MSLSDKIARRMESSARLSSRRCDDSMLAGAGLLNIRAFVFASTGAMVRFCVIIQFGSLAIFDLNLCLGIPRSETLTDLNRTNSRTNLNTSSGKSAAPVNLKRKSGMPKIPNKANLAWRRYWLSRRKTSYGINMATPGRWGALVEPLVVFDTFGIRNMGVSFFDYYSRSTANTIYCK
jgi:hypothetical protein